MKTKRFALIGTGFWSRYQLAGWQELEGVECVALCNRTKAKAEALAAEFGVPAVYDNAEEMLRKEDLDFIDIVTNVETHEDYAKLGAQHGVGVISQKPMAPDLAGARRMIAACAEAGVPFMVHENWRWQTALRAFKEVVWSGAIGDPWRARIEYNSSFDVFTNQPFLKELEQFILTDIGTHILDAARCLFGEAETLYARGHRVHRDIRGEDAVSVLMGMQNGMTVSAEMSYASRWEGERFPQTFVFVEGEDASAELSFDYWITVTTKEGVRRTRHAPPWYAWADARYDCIHSAIVSCNADLLAAMRGEKEAETSGRDNYETLRLVFGAYESIATGNVLRMKTFAPLS